MCIERAFEYLKSKEAIITAGGYHSSFCLLETSMSSDVVVFLQPLHVGTHVGGPFAGPEQDLSRMAVAR